MTGSSSLWLFICVCNDHMVFLLLIFQSVITCDFCYKLITLSSLCDLSIWICLWIPSYTNHMVFSLWSFNLYLLVNSVIHWSHGPFFVIFQFVFAFEFRHTLITWFSQSVFACKCHYKMITWFSLCDLSICICLWIPLYTDHMVLS